MALTSGPNLGLLVNGLLGEQHYNEFMRLLRGLDGLVQGGVKSATTTAQPATPADGDMYIIPTGATGAAWSTQVGKVARYSSVVGGWEFYAPKEGWNFRAFDTDSRMEYSGAAWAVQSSGGGGSTPCDLIVALGDETTAIAVGSSKVTLRAPRAMTLSAVKASLTAASTSGLPQFDVKKNGVTIFSTKPTIDVGEKTTATAATPPVLSTTTIAADDELTFDIVTAGTGAAGAKITLVAVTP